MSGRDVVVLGADGMLGRAMCQRLEAAQQPFRALTRAQCDLGVDERLGRAVEGASLLINCAAYTNVDDAETNERLATRINGTAVGVLAERCRDLKVPLIHFSTDYVFDGRAVSPYPVDHPRAPLGAYGRSKALGETLLESSGAEFLLLRTSWVYAPWGRNFVRTMASLLSSRPSVQVVADQRGRPSEARALAHNALRLFELGARGTFHVTDGGECSWYDLARAVARVIKSRADVRPCTTAEFPRPAPRPSYSVLDISETERLLGPLIHYEQQLEQMASAL